jgi:hypothetical protein
MARTKKVRDDPEERRLREIREKTENSKWIPEPTYLFQVGDQVEIGHLDNVLVHEVFEDGKFYEIDYSHTDTNYGNPITTHHLRGFWYWFDLRPVSSKRSETFIENKDLQLNYQQKQLDGLLHTLYHSRLNMNPSYQRGYVWGDEDKVALIDSIFKNIDIGKFVVVTLPYSESFLYEILDGKQRLRAIADFYENRFSYNGLFYNDLSRHEKYHFKNYPISYAQLDNLTNQQKLRYFLTLNRTGKVMSPEHLAKIEKMIE